jgi:RsiG-like
MTWLDTELSRVLDTHYLDGMQDRELDEIREMRTECEQTETAVSFLRRMAQGRLDLIHAYLDRRTHSELSDLREFVDELPSIIASGPPPKSGPTRFGGSRLPDPYPEDLSTELDAVLRPEQMSELESLDDDKLQSIAEELATMEKKLSQQRRSLHEEIDRIQAEIVSRYKTGKATVDGLLS